MRPASIFFNIQLSNSRADVIVDEKNLDVEGTLQKILENIAE